MIILLKRPCTLIHLFVKLIAVAEIQGAVEYVFEYHLKLSLLRRLYSVTLSNTTRCYWGRAFNICYAIGRGRAYTSGNTPSNFPLFQNE